MVTSRDIQIIDFVTSCGGATIEQIARVFFPSYDMARLRLAKIKELKSCRHPIINKKVYYLKTCPSYHSLIITDLFTLFKNELKIFRPGYDIGKHRCDAMMVFKNGKILIVEVDLHNKTSKTKIDAMLGELSAAGINADCVVITRRDRRERWEMGVEEIQQQRQEIMSITHRHYADRSRMA